MKSALGIRPGSLRDWLLPLAFGPLALAACSPSPSTPPADDAGAGDDAPSWLGDAGLVVRPPVQTPLRKECGIASNPGDMPLGADAASAFLRKGYFDAALDLGGVMVRRDFRWAQIEPQKGTFDFTLYDALVSEAQARGVPLLGALLYGAPWANAGSGGDEFYPPTDPGDFADYARATAEHFKGKVAAWEVWNEPNGGFRFWKGTLSGDPAAYGALLIDAHDAVRQADPNVPVLLGGTVFTPQLIDGAMTFLGKAYDAHPDLASHFEIAGIHTYASYPPERAPEVGELDDPPLEAKIQMHAWLLAQHGGGDKPIWITEIGWPVVEGAVDEAAQARFTVRATILAAHAGASGIFWYTLRDGPDPAAFPPEDAFGLLHDDADPANAKEATPKPVYLALKAMLARVGDMWPTTQDATIDGLPADARAIVFRGASGPAVTAVWTVTTAAATATWRGGPADVVGEMGDTVGSVDAGGSVAIGPDVVYVAAR